MGMRSAQWQGRAGNLEVASPDAPCGPAGLLMLTPVPCWGISPAAVLVKNTPRVAAVVRRGPAYDRLALPGRLTTA
jgi:hypothetical protein